MKYGYDYLDETDTLQTVATGTDKEKARRGAVRKSRKRGSAKLLFISEGGKEPSGAIIYVDGRMSSREGVTLGD